MSRCFVATANLSSRGRSVRRRCGDSYHEESLDVDSGRDGRDHLTGSRQGFLLGATGVPVIDCGRQQL